MSQTGTDRSSDITKADTIKAMLGWPRCPDCGKWLTPLAIKTGSGPKDGHWSCENERCSTKPRWIVRKNGLYRQWNSRAIGTIRMNLKFLPSEGDTILADRRQD